jgi:lysozyme
MSPETRDLLVSDLVRDEGEILHAYQDSLGYWTIGVGHLIDRRKSGGLTQAQSRRLLDDDLVVVGEDVAKYFPWSLQMSENRQRALWNLVFNLGGSNLSRWHQTIPAWREGRYQDAAALLRATKWYTQVGDRGPRIAELVEQG